MNKEDRTILHSMLKTAFAGK